MPPEQREAFCRGWARNLVEHVDGALYVCMSSKEWPTVSRVLEEAGAHWSDTLVWAKDRFTLGRADYQRQYEPIWYGWREGAKRHWCGDRDQGDVAVDRTALRAGEEREVKEIHDDPLEQKEQEGREVEEKEAAVAEEIIDGQGR